MKKKVKGDGWLTQGCHGIINDKEKVIKWELAPLLVV